MVKYNYKSVSFLQSGQVLLKMRKVKLSSGGIIMDAHTEDINKIKENLDPMLEVVMCGANCHTLKVGDIVFPSADAIRGARITPLEFLEAEDKDDVLYHAPEDCILFVVGNVNDKK